MSTFDDAYASAVGPREEIQEEVLRPLLEEVFVFATVVPTSLLRLRSALHALTTFLCSSSGRTSAHCRAVDGFFEDLQGQWLHKTEHLPEGFREVLAEFRFLHGAVDQPQYHTTPEEIRQMVDRLEAEAPQPDEPADRREDS